MPRPPPGYVTVWSTNQGEFYGNIYYHTADVLSDFNEVTVSFIQNQEKDWQISGTIYMQDVKIRGFSEKTGNQKPLSWADVTVNGFQTEADKNGVYILNMKAVPGKQYTALIMYDGMEAVRTFTVGDGIPDDALVPIYGTNIPFPTDVQVTVDDVVIDDDIVELGEESYVETEVTIHTTESFEVNEVYAVLYDEKGVLLSSEGLSYDKSTPNKVTWYTEAKYLYEGGKLCFYIKATPKGLSSSIYLPTIDSGIQFIKPAQKELISKSVPNIENIDDAELSTKDIPLIGKLLPKINLNNGALLVKTVVDYQNYYLLAGYEPSSETKTSTVSELKSKFEKAYQMYKDKDDLLEGKSNIDSQYMKDSPQYKPVIKFKLSYTVSKPQRNSICAR